MAERKRKIVPPAMLQKPVWTLKRQIMGNLVPLTLAGPMILVGLWLMYRSGKIGGVGLYLVGASIIVGWIMLNLFGLYENAKMKQQMSWRLDQVMKEVPSRRYFVGVATPRFKGMLDPHEDVGYLLVFNDRIEYYGEKVRVKFKRSEVKAVEAGINIHSLIALGGWVIIRAERDGKSAELRVEMREKPYLRSNRALNRMLLKRLKSWLA